VLLLLISPLSTPSADVPLEEIGRVEILDRAYDPHWLWAADASDARLALVDLDEGKLLGQINTGWGMPDAVFSRTRPEIYIPETYYSRGTRGTRTDVASIYDARSLSPVSEVILPPKRAINPGAIGNSALSDDDRFLAVFNMTPATSLSIVDVESRSLVGEISTPGCSLVYAVGKRRFATLCADGGLLIIELDEDGAVQQRIRSEPFFDPKADPVTEKAVRWGDRWLFVSFDGYVHPLDVSGETVGVEERWSLLSEGDRAGGWRVGGTQHLAVHQGSGRLYSLVHQGGESTHKDPGSEVWVYDLSAQKRVQRIELAHPGLAFMSETVEFGNDWIWPFSGLWDWMLDHVVPNPGLDAVQVTQDAAPLLVTGSQIGGSVAVYDAMSGELLRRVATGNMTTHALQAPWGGSAP
jgi:methylamine dehydrogenase heavy chain